MTLAYALSLIAAFMVGGLFGVLSIAIFNLNKPYNPNENSEEHY